MTPRVLSFVRILTETAGLDISNSLTACGLTHHNGGVKAAHIICLQTEGAYRRAHGDVTKLCQHLICQQENEGSPAKLEVRNFERVLRELKLVATCQSGFVFSMKTMQFPGEKAMFTTARGDEWLRCRVWTEEQVTTLADALRTRIPVNLRAVANFGLREGWNGENADWEPRL